MEDDELIDRAVAKGVMLALRRHKLLGNPVCDCRNGKVVWIAPEDIQIDKSLLADDTDEFPPVT